MIFLLLFSEGAVYPSALRDVDGGKYMPHIIGGELADIKDLKYQVI